MSLGLFKTEYSFPLLRSSPENFNLTLLQTGSAFLLHNNSTRLRLNIVGFHVQTLGAQRDGRREETSFLSLVIKRSKHHALLSGSNISVSNVVSVFDEEAAAWRLITQQQRKPLQFHNRLI